MDAKTKPEKGINTELEALLSETRDALEAVYAKEIREGKKIDRTSWVTVKEYCRRFQISDENIVLGWVKSGIIPPNETLIIEEYYNVRMIRAKPYPHIPK